MHNYDEFMVIAIRHRTDTVYNSYEICVVLALCTHFMVMHVQVWVFVLLCHCFS